MPVVRNFPRTVEETDNLWIPLKDGCRLAARMWRPDDAGQKPVPAILDAGISERNRQGSPFLVEYIWGLNS